jgi:hypothetical protein
MAIRAQGLFGESEDAVFRLDAYHSAPPRLSLAADDRASVNPRSSIAKRENIVSNCRDIGLMWPSSRHVARRTTFDRPPSLIGVVRRGFYDDVGRHWAMNSGNRALDTLLLVKAARRNSHCLSCRSGVAPARERRTQIAARDPASTLKKATTMLLRFALGGIFLMATIVAGLGGALVYFGVLEL